MYNNSWLKVDAEDKVTIAGFFYEKIDKKIKDGIYYIRLDKDYQTDVVSHNFIPLDIVNMYKSERAQEKNKKKKDKGKSVNISNLDLDQTVYLEDGSILLIGEKYYVTSYTTTSSNGSTTTRYVYHYEDILVTKIDSDGELIWMKKIPKIQRGGAGLGGMSYAYATHNNDHYFFFLDNLKNINLPPNERPATHSDGKGGIFTVVKIDNETGENTKNSLFDMKEVRMKGYKKPLTAYQFNVDRVLKTKDGIAVEVYKKGKEDIMIQIGIE